ncbi:MAG: cytochrome d ubiquinol oxidase subunit II [Alphaproteobacteria bacterium]|nr:cytochrome d ubiquinol oxidase subunit II [Alphaproteobacteria bacterium]
MFDLPTIWAGVICFALLAYVVLDGFDLGIGILFPLGKSKEERDRMMNTVAPVWDGNETWLVMGGGGLFAAFPVAYSVLLTAFYAPLILMLLALVLRGVAFEFRFRAERSRPLWDAAFIGGSTLAAFCQGIMIGAFVQGVAVEGRAYAGGWFDWLSPFTILCGFALVAGYALLGACWLVIKTDGALQARMRVLQLPLGALAMLAVAAVSGGTLLQHDLIYDRWFASPETRWIWIIPVVSALFSAWFVVSVRRKREVVPFLVALGLFVVSFAGLAASLYPYMIPPEVTFRDAANADGSLAFMLAGAIFLLPVILGYTGYNYWIFRGKVREGDAYH